MKNKPRYPYMQSQDIYDTYEDFYLLGLRPKRKLIYNWYHRCGANSLQEDVSFFCQMRKHLNYPRMLTRGCKV